MTIVETHAITVPVGYIVAFIIGFIIGLACDVEKTNKKVDKGEKSEL